MLQAQGRLSEWRQGWLVLLGATCSVSAAGTLFSYSSSLFVKPLETAFGWSRGEIAFGLTLVMLTVAISSPFVGALADRFGPKRIGTGAIILYAACCCGLSTIPASLPLYYCMLVLTAVMMSGTTAIVFAPLVIRKFQQNRGIALALMMSGTALILIPLSPILLDVNTNASWRHGYLMLGALALIVSLPGAILASRQSGGSGPASQDVPASGVSLAAAFRLPAYWKLQGGVIGSTLPLGGLLNQIPALLSDDGLSVALVGALTSTFAAFIIIGRTVSGLLFDFLHPPFIAASIMIGAAVGCLGLATGEVPIWLYFCSVALVGAAMGAEGDIQAFFVARQFGLKSYSTIFGTISMSTAVCLGVGAYVFGIMQETFGDYHIILIVSACSFGVSASMFALLGRHAGRPHKQTSN